MKINNVKWSKTSTMHFVKLIIRSLFLLLALGLYIHDKVIGKFEFLSNEMISTTIVLVVLGIYFIEMILRFFPNSIESMGCQKIFKRNYKEPTDINKPYDYPKQKGVLLTLAVWIGFNLIFGILYWTKIIDEGILVLLSLSYGVCDMICILFFCPFETWFMKNKCCNTCRIYNWDFAMMFTPLLFIPTWPTLVLGGLGLALAITWEIVHLLHKERYYEVSNDSLKCINCKEKLCTHKKQLITLANKIRKELENKSNKQAEK